MVTYNLILQPTGKFNYVLEGFNANDEYHKDVEWAIYSSLKTFSSWFANSYTNIVSYNFKNLTQGKRDVLAEAGPKAFTRYTALGPEPNTRYDRILGQPGPLYQEKVGADITPGDVDIVISIDSSRRFDTGSEVTDPKLYHLQSTLLHELMHGMGFSSSLGGTNQTTSLDDRINYFRTNPTVWDYYLVDSNNKRLLDYTDFGELKKVLTDISVNGGFYFSSPIVNAKYGKPAKVDPVTETTGGAHLDSFYSDSKDTRNIDGLNELMTPSSSGPGIVDARPGPIAHAILQTFGYHMNPALYYGTYLNDYKFPEGAWERNGVYTPTIDTPLEYYGLEGNDTLYGGNRLDYLFGGIGDDYLNGLGYSDQLWGEAGNDSLVGLTGWDHLYGGLDNDHFYVDSAPMYSDASLNKYGLYKDFIIEAGSQGIDTVEVSFISPPADIEIPQLAFEYYDMPDNVENLIVSDFSTPGFTNVSFGTAFNNKMTGNNQANRMHGFSGDDTLVGGAGEDTLSGWDGHDILNGEADRDTLKGDEGNDFIVGAEGADYLTGGTGSDQFFYNSIINTTDAFGTYKDVIFDFNSSEDCFFIQTENQFYNQGLKTLAGGSIGNLGYIDPTQVFVGANFPDATSVGFLIQPYNTVANLSQVLFRDSFGTIHDMAFMYGATSLSSSNFILNIV